MQNILIHLESGDHASVFDQITAIDAGADQLLAYDHVQPEEVQALVHGAMFTRGGADLKHTAIFIGGSDVPRAEKLLQKTLDCFFGKLRVSVMMDANGANTTAAAMVRKLAADRDLRGKKALVLAGTGPVGIRTAVLLAAEGCEVSLTSRRLERAAEAAAYIREHYDIEVAPRAVANDEELLSVLAGGVEIAACCGAAGVGLLSENVLALAGDLRLVADINAVPPLGVAGSDVMDNGTERNGKLFYGAIAIGNLKMKIHHRAVADLFTANDLVYDFREIYGIAKSCKA